MIEFWNTIHESGQLHVDPPATGAQPVDQTTLRDAIVEIEAQWRLDLPFEPPNLIVPVALWSIERMYQACQCLVYREIDPDMVAAALAVESPAQQPHSPDACYSADLGLRILP